MKFSFRDFFSKCDQIRSFLRIWSHLLKQFSMENLTICAVNGYMWVEPIYENTANKFIYLLLTC